MLTFILELTKAQIYNIPARLARQVFDNFTFPFVDNFRPRPGEALCGNRIFPLTL